MMRRFERRITQKALRAYFDQSKEFYLLKAIFKSEEDKT